MALARNLRTLIVLGTVASLIATGAIWAYQAVAQGPPECPADWPGQGYEGPLRPRGPRAHPVRGLPHRH